MLAALLRTAYVAGATGVTLVAWGFVAALVAWGADNSSDEELSGWTLFVVGPIIVVYVGVLVGLAWGRWRVWRWLPVAVLVSGIVGLVVQTGVDGAARAYEPEETWITLWWLAPLTAGAVSLVVEVYAWLRSRRDTAGPSYRRFAKPS